MMNGNIPATAIGINLPQRQMTVPQLYDAVGDEVIRRWELLGQTESKIHWAYGHEADDLISEGYPAMTVYKAIAIKAGIGSQVIRKAYYTYKSFSPEQREKYDLCPYSVFQIARTQEKPEEVLQHYIDHQTSVDEIEVLYPEKEDIEFETYFRERGYPRMFYGIVRELWGCDEFLRARAEELMNELTEIIRKVNQ